MEQNKAKGLTRADLLAITTFDVRLTYTFTETPIAIVFKCKMALDEDDRQARQAFYSQPDGDIEKGKHAYNVEMLGRIVQGVEGLPGFDEVVANDEPGTPTLAFRLSQYFQSAEPILVKIAADAVDQYSRISQPAEFFR